ncbi:MAG: hypothetical protein KBH06_07170 [Spirochaetes bacterium]|nr:hypothetical protein [Spirochaetota bacterium]
MKDFIYRSIRSIYILFVIISFSSCSYSILVSINNCSNDVYKLKFKLNDDVKKYNDDYDPFYTGNFQSVKDIDFDMDWKEVIWKNNIKGKDFFEIDLMPGETIRLESAWNTLSDYHSNVYEYVEITNLNTNAKIIIYNEMMRDVLQKRYSGILRRPYAYLNLK